MKKLKTDWQDAKAVRRAAMDLLARREHSRFELQQKLRKKGSPVFIIEQILAELAAEKLLSDERFVEAYINHRAGQGYGPLRIYQELIERGIAKDLISECLHESDEQWFKLVETVRRKKFGETLPQTLLERAKQARFLQYRGFNFAQLKSLTSSE